MLRVDDAADWICDARVARGESSGADLEAQSSVRWLSIGCQLVFWCPRTPMSVARRISESRTV
eukprot:498666-Rhodomonas_salina.7